MSRFIKTGSGLKIRKENETLLIEGWGRNALRVRATLCADFSGDNKALEYVEPLDMEIRNDESSAVVRNGRISCVYENGYLTFYRDKKQILKEYSRDGLKANEHGSALGFHARNFKPIKGSGYKTIMRFDANDGEKIYGMGQYQQPMLNLKGCILEMAQRNSQISIPFYLSSLGYGFLWNNEGVGEVVFGENYTQWTNPANDEIDYYITADDTPKDILRNYTEVVGRAPEFPDNALGLWQCKLRYRTQEEVLGVAEEYKRRGIPLDVIVIDYFHWVRQGDFDFDPTYWPNPKEMVDRLKEMGIRCMVSVWPTIDKKSVNYEEMKERGMLVRTEGGSAQCMDFLGDTVFYDATNPEAREFIWEKVKESYYKYGIDMFWLDEAEPEYSSYDFEQYRYFNGPVLKSGNVYPKLHAKAFYDGQKSEGQTDIVNLLRCAWVGSQKYGALVWSGDIRSTFTSFRDQVAAGLNMGIAGIPWWVSDTGGFVGNVNDEHFVELLIRWFQFSAFCPVLRMHGFREPDDIPPLSDLDYGGGFCNTGRPNELWSFGEEAYNIMRKYLDIRLGMKDYIKSLFDEASENGSPIIRTMFYEFPDDEKCWEVDEQYMFGSKYLVAPVLYQGMEERSIYLPQGKWRSIHSGEVFEGGRTVKARTPIDIMPVYELI